MTLFCTYVLAATPLKDTVSSPWYLTVLLIASVIAGIAFLVTGVIYLWQYISSRKKEAIHRDLVESFKRLGLTDKMAEVAAKGSPPGPYVEGLDDDGWMTPREGYKILCLQRKRGKYKIWKFLSLKKFKNSVPK